MVHPTGVPNGRNLELELEKARLIQDLLLPRAVPKLYSAGLCFKFVPYYDLSGDFLDYYYKRSTEELGFIICDVSGHGVPSALIAAMMKMALQLWGEYLDDPAGTLTKIRNMFLGKLGNYFVSAILGYLDLKTGFMKCVNAGHPGMLHLRASDSTISEIKPMGCIIHEEVFCELEEYSTTLSRGDLLVLFTDGLIEARNKDGEELGVERLKELLIRFPDSSTTELCDQIIQTAMEHSSDGKNLHDDVSLFLIQYTGN